MVEVQAYALPRGERLLLGERPRLASWNAARDADQRALNAYLDAAVDLLGPTLPARRDDLAVRLDVGLPDTVDVLDQRDLDNYLFPLATRLQRRGHSLVSCWATKAHRAESWLRAETAVPVGLPSAASARVSVTTTASSDSVEFKQQVNVAVAHLDVLQDGPVALEVAFAVGPRRNWINLWKPTIDALDPILGRTTPDRPWHPRDGRITRLGLHRHLDPALGNAVNMVIVAEAARGD